ncbi:MAG TPA: M13 family metallopeptidase [Terriglobales bacterium]|nr:M13 family metallopeptidase [Terriglobales bacterium]
MRLLFALLVLLSIIPISLAQSNSSATGADAEPAAPFSAVDKSANPCTDFYQYSCGNWLKTAKIPPDQSSWGTFPELAERNRDILRAILEKAAVMNPERDSIDQKIGDYYESCMDEKTVDDRGLQPLKPELDRVAAVQDKQGLIDAIARVHMIGPNPLFNFYSQIDLHNAQMVIAYIDQGGLSLPDRDYYIKDDAHMKQIREQFLEYATQLFTLDGQPKEKAEESAKTVLHIETALAKAAMDRTERRDPKTRDHKMTEQEASQLAPNFQLAKFFADVNAPQISELNVSNPEFFKQVNQLLESEPLDAWKTYVTWHLLDGSAPWLSQPFVDANFKMQQALTGQSEIKPRWKRCVAAVDDEVGEALGERYVEKTFGADGKRRMLKMVEALEKSLSEDIQNLPWMSDETKKQAQLKLNAIHNKIGYPNVWRNYSTLTIERGDLLPNFFRGNEFESKRDINKIGKPPDPNEWGMTPPTVNAYYSPPRNEIVFPAGILQPPFFDKNADDATNFGSIGVVIGHELTHGFDDQGRKYDSQGNLRDWWTPEDATRFEERASCVANEYSNFTVIDDLKLNGRLTLGENTADNGGARIALAALHHYIHDNKLGKASQTIDGYTPEQRFYLGYARIWCELRRPELARARVTTDPHSPGKWRVDGVVENSSDFDQAFSCKAGDPMVSKDACRVW